MRFTDPNKSWHYNILDRETQENEGSAIATNTFPCMIFNELQTQIAVPYVGPSLFSESKFPAKGIGGSCRNANKASFFFNEL